MALFEIDEGLVRKFYRIERVGNSIELHWGRLGTSGLRKTTSYATPLQASLAYDDEVLRRRRRNYQLVIDEDKPHDAEQARQQQTKQTLTSVEPLSQSPRFMFVHRRTQQFAWLEQHAANLRSAAGNMQELSSCRAQTSSFVSEREAQRTLEVKMRELLTKGYTLNAFDADRKAPAKKRSANKPAVDRTDGDTSSVVHSNVCRHAEQERWVFFGAFEEWPNYHGASPQEIAQRRGAVLVDTLDATVSCVVFGQGRGIGKAKAVRDAQRLQKAGCLRVLDEAMFRELAQIDLTGKRFHFVGSFDCAPGDDDFALVANMVTSRGGVVVATASNASTDYVVSGSRLSGVGPGKVKIENAVDKWIAEGAPIVRLTESDFLQLVRIGSSAATIDFSGFVAELYAVADERKISRAMKMLRSERCSLYADVQKSHLLGVVRSQTDPDTVYASWISSDGNFGCVETDETNCMGIGRGKTASACKHLLVLTIGLVRNHQLDAKTAIAWLRASVRNAASSDATRTAHAFLQYAAALAGEIDWRPTETVPEDYYAT
jgi:predicted DNA-binding WGR domain protein